MANHDRAYKKLFHQKRMVSDLLELIDEDWVREIRPGSLKPMPTVRVNDQLKERLSDLVWRAKWGEMKIPVDLLMEFQSIPDRTMPLRLQIGSGLHSQSLLNDGQVSERGKVPRVFPMLLYNGLARWTTPEDAYTLYEDAPAGLECYLPRQPYYLLDVQRFDAASLQGRRNAAAALIRLENAASAEEIEAVVSDLMEWFPGSVHQPLRRAFAAWLCRVLLPARFPDGEFSCAEELQEVKSMLAERVKQWPREWEEKGRTQGLQEGQCQLLEQLLKQKFGKIPKPLRDRLSRADSQTLSEWAGRILTAQTLDQVLDGRQHSSPGSVGARNPGDR